MVPKADCVAINFPLVVVILSHVASHKSQNGLYTCQNFHLFSTHALLCFEENAAEIG
jgi:hypothetical protein